MEVFEIIPFLPLRNRQRLTAQGSAEIRSCLPRRSTRYGSVLHQLRWILAIHLQGICQKRTCRTLGRSTTRICTAIADAQYREGWRLENCKVFAMLIGTLTQQNDRMKIVLHGISAFQWWLRAKTRAAEQDCFDERVLTNSSPSKASLNYLRDSLSFIDDPIHVVVPSPGERRAQLGMVSHVASSTFPSGSFLRVDHGIYVSSPELCFLQLANAVSFLDLVRMGYTLCGSFAISPDFPSGLCSRIPLTSSTSIKEFAQLNAGSRGCRKAQKAISLVCDNAASPREAELAMKLTLPYRYGGFGIAQPQLNAKVDVGRAGSALTGNAYYVADLFWQEKRVIVEYDSDLHLTAEQAAHDAAKRRSLEASGFKVITVTKLQLSNVIEMKRTARGLSRLLGSRIRPRRNDYEKLQLNLFDYFKYLN